MRWEYYADTKVNINIINRGDLKYRNSKTCHFKKNNCPKLIEINR